MAIYQSEDRLRIKRIRAEKAIQLAMQNRWAEAAEINRQIIELFPDDVDSQNRLGKALMEMGRYREAREAYTEASRLDPTNTIAARNLQRLERLVDEQGDAVAPTPVDPRLFIEESGKTVVTMLSDIAEPAVVVKLNAGDTLTLEPEGNIVRLVDQIGNIVGQLEPKLAKRVLKLLQSGNKYSAAVTGADEQFVRVIVREVSRDPSMGRRPSFPMAMPPEQFRAYLKDSLVRYDLDEDEDLMEEAEPDAEAEAEPAANADLTLEETPLAEAEAVDDDED